MRLQRGENGEGVSFQHSPSLTVTLPSFSFFFGCSFARSLRMLTEERQTGSKQCELCPLRGWSVVLQHPLWSCHRRWQPNHVALLPLGLAFPAPVLITPGECTHRLPGCDRKTCFWFHGMLVPVFLRLSKSCSHCRAVNSQQIGLACMRFSLWSMNGLMTNRRK